MNNYPVGLIITGILLFGYATLALFTLSLPTGVLVISTFVVALILGTIGLWIDDEAGRI